MVSQSNNSNELYNLRWNSYLSNLINVFTNHQKQESLVDVTIGCEGRFIKAHKLVLSACSVYFQKIFQSHPTPQLMIILNDAKFENLKLVIQFMYKGEVKVADTDMHQFLQLGKMLQVKGLCSVELQEKQKQNCETNEREQSLPREMSPTVIQEKQTVYETKTELLQTPEISTNDAVKFNDNKKIASPLKVIEQEHLMDLKETPPVKKRKLLSPVPSDSGKSSASPISTGEIKDFPRIPRPPNAFMIFANQWRKKLAVEYPNESNKDISVRLGNMWKSLSPETRDGFYDDARKAEEDHKLMYPGYVYNPKHARHRKAIAQITKAAKQAEIDTVKDDTSDSNEPEFIEIKCEEDLGD